MPVFWIYGDEALGRIAKWIDWGILTCLWADRIYIAGILTAAICIFGKRMRFRRITACMKKMSFGNMQIYVMDMNVMPFTTGLLKPKIVLPKVMVDSYSRDELMTIIQHERMHIRLGHLWCGFAWDIRTAQEYGLILLKSLKLLRSEREDILPAATYAGEKDFADMKRRIRKIAGFHPYRKGLCTGMTAAAFMIIGLVLLVIQNHSYAAQGMMESGAVNSAKKKETEKTAEKVRSSRSESTAEYVTGLSKLAPSVEFRVENTHASDPSGKTLTINPKLQ